MICGAVPSGRGRVCALGTQRGRWGIWGGDGGIWGFISETAEHMEDGGGRKTERRRTMKLGKAANPVSLSEGFGRGNDSGLKRSVRGSLGCEAKTRSPLQLA